MKVAVSACLLGVPCRYDGRSKQDPRVQSFVETGSFKGLPVSTCSICPEVMAGLTIPHPPHEIRRDAKGELHVVDKMGHDATAAFIKGALNACEKALKAGCTHAILKSKSPSCGVGEVYDGTFTGTLVAGDGIASQMMQQAGIRVATEKDFEEVFGIKDRIVSD